MWKFWHYSGITILILPRYCTIILKYQILKNDGNYGIWNSNFPWISNGDFYSWVHHLHTAGGFQDINWSMLDAIINRDIWFINHVYYRWTCIIPPSYNQNFAIIDRDIYLAGWWWLEPWNLDWLSMLGRIIPTDELIFFRGLKPPTRIEYIKFKHVYYRWCIIPPR